METPSLRARLTGTGAGLVAALLIVVNTIVYLGVRDRLDDTLHDLLLDRAEFVRTLADELEPDPLLERLSAAGIPVTIREPDGTVRSTQPQTARSTVAPPFAGIPGPPRLEVTVELPEGGLARVYASRLGVETTLRNLLLVQALASLVGVVIAGLLLRRGAAAVLRPLDAVVDTARRTATGKTGQRLQPDRPDTELGRMAIAFDEMVEALEAAVDDARAAQRYSHEFLADAAHQLRTPLTGIQGSVEALLREDDAELRDRLLGNVIRETRRTSRLLRSLLTVARLDRGEPANVEPTDLVTLLDDEIDRAEALAPHLAIELHADGPVVAPADGHALREAIGNLLDNARRHARSRIEVGLARDDGQVEVTVADDGPGIPVDRREEVFRRFASLDDGGGTGLGLPIARGIARAHGGDLVYDERGFTVTLSTVPPGDRSAVAD
jgi:two-component system, OmpR family, sensor kinase